MRRKIGKALVQRFHAETSTFHLSCREYVILSLDWTAILGIRFGGYLILTDDMSFKMACELLGIPLPLTIDTKGYFRPITSPQICTEWLKGSIPWSVVPTDIHLRRFFMYSLGSCFFGNNRSVLSCQLLWAIRVVSDVGRYDWGSIIYDFFISFLRQASQQDFRSLERCWQILAEWTYKYIPALDHGSQVF